MDGQAIKDDLFHTFFFLDGGGGGVTMQGRTIMVHPITMKKMKCKKAIEHPRLPTRTKELSEESQSRLVTLALAEKRPLLVVHHLVTVMSTK